MIAAMVVLTPTVFHTRSTPWTMGWVAILLGAFAVQVLLMLVEHLAPAADRPRPDDVPEA
ncbi:hypothetical protein [Streptomyces lavendulae]|uniref:hypothetical protein n=1 Tax=Streptomyces lavendulae TaxID=1914 RepID=UPI0025567594|nr:hypothetical protein [Streptomyces lavendulae]